MLSLVTLLCHFKKAMLSRHSGSILWTWSDSNSDSVYFGAQGWQQPVCGVLNVKFLQRGLQICSLCSKAGVRGYTDHVSVATLIVCLWLHWSRHGPVAPKSSLGNSFLKTTYTSHIRVSDQIWLEVERTAGRVRGPDPSLCLVNTSEKRSIWKAWISDNLWPNQEIKHSLWRFNRFFMEYLILKIDT